MKIFSSQKVFYVVSFLGILIIILFALTNRTKELRERKGIFVKSQTDTSYVIYNDSLIAIVLDNIRILDTDRHVLCKEALRTGDIVTIYFYGFVLESNPAQIPDIAYVVKNEEGSYTDIEPYLPLLTEFHILPK